MTTTTRTRRATQPTKFPKRPSKYPPPATGTLRWLVKPDADGNGGTLIINGVAYGVSPVRQDAKYNREHPVIGWRLAKLSTTTSYDVGRCEDGTLSCECMDYCHNRQFAVTAQGRACKHIRALEKALPAVKQPLPVPDGWGTDAAEAQDAMDALWRASW